MTDLILLVVKFQRDALVLKSNLLEVLVMKKNEKVEEIEVVDENERKVN